MNDQNKPFTILMKKYFGLKAEQNNAAFAAELKELGEQDRLFFAEELAASGLVPSDLAAIKAKASGLPS